MRKHFSSRQGFSLIQVSAVLVVGSILLVSMIPGGRLGSESEKANITYLRMQKIEDAMQAFMVANNRRPCPADGSLALTSANFGVEAANNGQCEGGTPAANLSNKISGSITGTTTRGSRSLSSLSSTASLKPGMAITGSGIQTGSFITSVDSASAITLNLAASATASGVSLTFYNIAAGMVPVRTLGLPDEYALDGWNRRIMYTVDVTATEAKACRSRQFSGANGTIQIQSSYSSGISTTFDYTMWALTSYGKDGHGAYTIQGSSSRNNVYLTSDSDTLNNASVTALFADSFTGKLVKKSQTSTFDDIVWYQNSTKNTCCMGKQCNGGFKMTASTNQFDATAGITTAVGDVNGDGNKDLIVGVYGTASYGRVYVLFGGKDGWPSPPTALNLYDGSTSDLNGANGFTFYFDSAITNFARSVGAGDINNDGYDDIFIGGTNRLIVLYGGPGQRTGVDTYETGWPATITFSTDLNGSNGFIVRTCGMACAGFIPATNGSIGSIVVGDIDGDGVKDVAWAQSLTSNIVWLLKGITSSYNFNPTAWNGNNHAYSQTSAPATYDISTMAASEGLKLTYTALAAGLSGMAVGDFNTDGVDDLAFAQNNAAYCAIIMFGRKTGVTQPTSFTTTGTSPATMALNTLLGSIFTATTTIGSSCGAAPPNSTAVQRFPCTNSATNLGIKAEDLNNDGYKDLLLYHASKIYAIYSSSTLCKAFPYTTLDTAANFMINSTSNLPSSSGANQISISANTLPTVTGVALGDVNGDGRTDILMGSHSTNPNNKGISTGSVFVLYQPSDTTGWISAGSGSPPTITMFGTSTGTTTGNYFHSTTGLPLTDANGVSRGFRIDGEATSDGAFRPDLIDLNKDGIMDITIGSPGYANSQVAEYILFGRKNVPWESTAPVDLANWK